LFFKLSKKNDKTRLKSGKKKNYSGPDGKRAYAIGDVHGRLDLLKDLILQIEADVTTQDTLSKTEIKSHVILLGDLIDRGPDSKGVIEFLNNYTSDYITMHFVSGNHEESLIRSLRGEPELIDPWLEHGGFATAKSYGLERGHLYGRTSSGLEQLLQSSIPEAHIEFLATFADSVQFGDYLFVHAGIRPGVPIADQDTKDFHWIRGEFLDSKADHGVIVVHGHTIVENIDQRGNRIAMDTGAYKTGLLSAVCIEGTGLRYLQAYE